MRRVPLRAVVALLFLSAVAALPAAAERPRSVPRPSEVEQASDWLVPAVQLAGIPVIDVANLSQRTFVEIPYKAIQVARAIEQVRQLYEALEHMEANRATILEAVLEEVEVYLDGYASWVLGQWAILLLDERAVVYADPDVILAYDDAFPVYDTPFVDTEPLFGFGWKTAETEWARSVMSTYRQTLDALEQGRSAADWGRERQEIAILSQSSVGTLQGIQATNLLLQTNGDSLDRLTEVVAMQLNTDLVRNSAEESRRSQYLKALDLWMTARSGRPEPLIGGGQ